MAIAAPPAAGAQPDSREAIGTTKHLHVQLARPFDPINAPMVGVNGVMIGMELSMQAHDEYYSNM